MSFISPCVTDCNEWVQALNNNAVLRNCRALTKEVASDTSACLHHQSLPCKPQAAAAKVPCQPDEPRVAKAS
eukprot:3340653-Amphidinium_carterae.1